MIVSRMSGKTIAQEVRQIGISIKLRFNFPILIQGLDLERPQLGLNTFPLTPQSLYNFRSVSPIRLSNAMVGHIMIIIRKVYLVKSPKAS